MYILQIWKNIFKKDLQHKFVHVLVQEPAMT
jgi:hypothetical protein